MKSSANTTHQMVKNMVLAALFLAMGLALPFLTGQIPQIGNMLCPMHLPVLICGLICGWGYGGAVGFVLPLFRHVLFGMPPFPNNIAMAFELATYGILSGFLYSRSKRQYIVSLYCCLIAAMVGGRIVWGCAMVVITGLAGSSFTWAMFMASAFLNAIPGIILQLVFIPALMVALDRTGMVHFRRKSNANAPLPKS